MLTQKKFTRTSKLQQDYINLSAKKQKSAQAKYEDMELDGYKNDAYNDPLNRPNIQYSDPNMQFQNNNMSNNMPQMNATNVPVANVPVANIPVALPATNVTSLSLNNLLADLLDYIDSYTGDNDTLYNKIINTLNAVEQSIKTTLNGNRNAYTDIVSALQVFNERLQQTKGYPLMKNIIDERLIMIKRLIETYQKNIVKSKTEIEAEDKRARETEKANMDGRQEFDALLTKFTKHAKTTKITIRDLKRLIEMYQKNPDLANKDTDTKNILKIAINDNENLILRENFTGQYPGLVHELKKIFNSYPANTEAIVVPRPPPVAYTLNDQLVLRLNQTKITLERYIGLGNSDNMVTNYFNKVKNELLTRPEYFNNPLNLKAISDWANEFTDYSDYPLLDIAATEFIEIKINKQTPFTSHKFTDLNNKRNNIELENKIEKYHQDVDEQEDFIDKMMVKTNKHYAKEAKEWKKIMHMDIAGRDIIREIANRTEPSPGRNAILNGVVNASHRFIQNAAQTVNDVVDAINNLNGIASDDDSNNASGSGITGSGLIDSVEINALAAQLFEFMTQNFHIQDREMVMRLNNIVFQKLYEFSTTINTRHDRQIGLPSSGRRSRSFESMASNNGNININVGGSPGRSMSIEDIDHSTRRNNNSGMMGNMLGTAFSLVSRGPTSTILDMVTSRLGSYSMLAVIVLLMLNNVYQYAYGAYTAMGTRSQIENLEKTNKDLMAELAKNSERFTNERMMLDKQLTEYKMILNNSKVTFSEREKNLIETIVNLTEQCNITIDAHIGEIKNMHNGDIPPTDFMRSWTIFHDETMLQINQWKYIIMSVVVGLVILLLAGVVFYESYLLNFPTMHAPAAVNRELAERVGNENATLPAQIAPVIPAIAQRGPTPRIKSASPAPTNPVSSHGVTRSRIRTNSIKPSKSRATRSEVLPSRNDSNDTVIESQGKGLQGGNMLTAESSVLDQNGPTNALSNALNKYGNMPISGIAVFRHTIPSALNFVAKRILPYDDLYHLGLFIKVHTGAGEKLLKLDKESYIMLREMDSIPSTEALMQIPMAHATLNQIFDKMKLVYPGLMWRYNAISNNCQIFVMMVLSVLNRITPEVKEFVLQDKVQNYKNPYVEKFMQAATRLHGFVNGNIMGGDIKNDKLYGNENKRTTNMVENYMLNEQRIKK